MVQQLYCIVFKTIYSDTMYYIRPLCTNFKGKIVSLTVRVSNYHMVLGLEIKMTTREEESDAVELQLKKNIIRNMK